MRYVFILLLSLISWDIHATLRDPLDFSDVPEYSQFMTLTSIGNFQEASDFLRSKISQTNQEVITMREVGFPLQWVEKRDEIDAQLNFKKEEIRIEESLSNGDITKLTALIAEKNQLTSERILMSRQYCPTVYGYNAWLILQKEAELRATVFDNILKQVESELGVFSKVNTQEPGLPEEFIWRGSNFVRKLYDIVAIELFSKSINLQEAVIKAQEDIQEFQVQFGQNNLNVYLMFNGFSEGIKKSPARGLIDYHNWNINYFKATDAPNKNDLILMHETASKSLQHQIDGNFKRLYPGAMLYKLFVPTEILPKQKFPDFIRQLEELLGWDLPTGVALEAMVGDL